MNKSHFVVMVLGVVAINTLLGVVGIKPLSWQWWAISPFLFIALGATVGRHF